MSGYDLYLYNKYVDMIGDVTYTHSKRHCQKVSDNKTHCYGTSEHEGLHSYEYCTSECYEGLQCELKDGHDGAHKATAEW